MNKDTNLKNKVLVDREMLKLIQYIRVKVPYNNPPITGSTEFSISGQNKIRLFLTGKSETKAHRAFPGMTETFYHDKEEE